MTLPYNATIFEHFRHPRNYGALPSPDVVYEDVSPLCGDRIRMELKIGADQIIAIVRFRGDSCIISRAAASLLTELVQGRPLREVAALPQNELVTALNAPIRPARMKCALLPLHVLQAGISAYLREGCSVAQRCLRQELARQKDSLPNQINQPTPRPT